MEAATPLRKPHVRIVSGALAVDGLVVEDETAVRVVREREEAGTDPAEAVSGAIEIGARVLDREQAAANADFVRAEFEKVAKGVEVEFADRARAVAEFFGGKVDEVFGEETGRLAKELERLFSDGSSTAVQHRVRELVGEVMVKAREDLVRQFSAADASNPLADFKASTIRQLEQAEARQHRTHQILIERMGEVDKQLQAMQLEKEGREQVAHERERGTAKGRTFEERVAEAVDAIAAAQGDCSEAVGDLKGVTGKTGDVVVEVGAAVGPAQGRLVFEAKDSRLSQPQARRELDRAMEQRDADFGVLVVPGDEELPARMHELREYNGDKLIVSFDPDAGSTLALEVGYRLARARVLMARAGADGVDGPAVRAAAERALGALDEARKVKSQLTGAVTQIDKAREIVEGMESTVRRQLEEIDTLVKGGPQTALDV